jgi:hypothetical protein
MVDMFGGGVVLADAKLIVVRLFFLEVVLVASIHFPFTIFCTEGSLWPIKGFSITRQYLIGLPLALVSGGDVSINCKGNNSTSISKNRCTMRDSDSKKVEKYLIGGGVYSGLILAQYRATG